MASKAKAKDLAFEAKAKDLVFKAKAKDLASKAKAKAKDRVKANVNMVRCSVKTSKHRFITGLVMNNFILIARFSKLGLVIKLTVSFSQRTLKYFRVQWIFFK